MNSAHGCKLSKMEMREIKVLPQERIGPYLMEADKRGLLAVYYLKLTTGLRHTFVMLSLADTKRDAADTIGSLISQAM